MEPHAAPAHLPCVGSFAGTERDVPPPAPRPPPPGCPTPSRRCRAASRCCCRCCRARWARAAASPSCCCRSRACACRHCRSRAAARGWRCCSCRPRVRGRCWGRSGRRMLGAPSLTCGCMRCRSGTPRPPTPSFAPHAPAPGLAAALFRLYPAQRAALMSDFLTHVVSQLGGGGRALQRHVIAGGGGGQPQVAVHVASAAAVRMVQASVALPPLDAPADAARACYSAAAFWAGAFWDGVFDLLPAARAAKSDSAQDTRGVVEGLLTGALEGRGGACLIWQGLLLPASVHVHGRAAGSESAHTPYASTPRPQTYWRCSACPSGPPPTCCCGSSPRRSPAPRCARRLAHAQGLQALEGGMRGPLAQPTKPKSLPPRRPLPPRSPTSGPRTRRQRRQGALRRLHWPARARPVQRGARGGTRHVRGQGQGGPWAPAPAPQQQQPWTPLLTAPSLPLHAH
jgi:hypothetical protein